MSVKTRPQKCTYCRRHTAHNKDVCPFWVHFMLFLFTCGFGLMFSPFIFLWDAMKPYKCHQCGGG